MRLVTGVISGKLNVEMRQLITDCGYDVKAIRDDWGQKTSHKDMM